MPINSNIFSDKIFGDQSELMKRLKTQNLDYDEPEYSEDMFVENITVFDYILGNKLDILPFDGDRIYYDWLGYDTTSTTTIREFYKFISEHTISQIVNSVPVHQDLFLDMNIDKSSFFMAFCIPPQAYKICDTQWDAYLWIYLMQCEKTSSFDNLLSPSAEMINPDDYIDIACAYNRFTAFINSAYRKRPYQCCCSESSPPVPEASVHLYANLYNACWLFTSKIGINDWRYGRVYGVYGRGENCLYTSVDPRELTPAAYPNLKVGTSFFSDVYGPCL